MKPCSFCRADCSSLATSEAPRCQLNHDVRDESSVDAFHTCHLALHSPGIQCRPWQSGYLGHDLQGSRESGDGVLHAAEWSSSRVAARRVNVRSRRKEWRWTAAMARLQRQAEEMKDPEKDEREIMTELEAHDLELEKRAAAEEYEAMMQHQADADEAHWETRELAEIAAAEEANAD